jgi:nanoRNase/pAp phosphatase (c-di-AMP/oligoRNAs hydrolase)
MVRDIGNRFFVGEKLPFTSNQSNPVAGLSFNAEKSVTFNSVKADTVQLKGKDYLIKKAGKLLHIISFTGKPELPVYGIKTKVRGVTRYQKNCQKLLESNWQDGDSIVLRKKPGKSGLNLEFIHPQFGTLGRIPDEVSPKIAALLDEGHKFNVELSDVVGGSIGAPTIGLRMNIKYDIEGDAKINNMSVYGTFKNKVNAEKLLKDGKIGDQLVIKPYSKGLDVIHPKFGKVGEVFADDVDRIKDAVKDGTYKATINAISKGSKKYPDMIFVKYNFVNTAGGQLKNVPEEVSKAFKELTTDPETKHMTFPYQPIETPDKLVDLLFPKPVVNNIIDEINKAKSILLVGHKSPDGDTLGCVLGLNASLKKIGKDVSCCVDDDITGLFRHKLVGLDENIKKAKDLPDKKYDLVIIMDTPTPMRIGGASKYIKEANKVVFLDHHPKRIDEWKDSISETGVDLEKIEKQGLLWVRDDIPAAAEMAASLAFKILPEKVLNSLSVKEKQEIAIPLVTGMMTDSGNFARGADKKIESLAKYMMEWAGFGKKLLRDGLNYNIPTEAREKMIKYSQDSVLKEDDIAYGSLQIPYDKFIDVYNTAKKDDPDVIKQDVINEFKFSEVFSSLRTDPKTYDDDKIAVSMIQKAVKEVEGEDVITISLRSGQGSDYSQKIASEFGGGGHGAASGATVLGHKLDTKKYSDTSSNQKLTLERKIAALARQFRTEAQNNVVSFTGWLNKLIKKAS